jgi:alpha-beta hydrolase superfamily lysophospholipase
MRVDTRLIPAREIASALVVVVHGLKKRMLETVPPAVAEYLPDADILLAMYNAGYLSNLSPVTLASDISDEIQRQYDHHRKTTGEGYRRLILVGHSRGALLVRKAYVFARGEAQELEQGGMRLTPLPWHRAVDRIVLLAGMNRGWTLWPKAPQMGWGAWCLRRCALALARLTRQCKLMRELERGAPFVANLRIQWIRASRGSLPMPRTIQILGDMDDLVSPHDNIDLQAGRDFVYLKAPPGTTHASVIELDDPRRRDVFRMALVEPNPPSQYMVPLSQESDDRVTRVVFVVHGIRDFGGWTSRLSDALRRAAERGGEVVAPVTAGYGYFPMGKFLLLSQRQKNVRWFMDEYTQALARYRYARAIDFVGHSNGTYLLGSALRRYRSCSFGRVVCAGSVLPRDFEWDVVHSESRVAAVRNYLASGDWVVGIFPNLFDSRGDIGGGGFLGFVREPAVSNQFRYVAGGHGAAIVEDNFESIADFLVSGTTTPPPEKIRAEAASGWVVLASKLDWVIWALLVSIVIIGAWYVAFAWTPAFIPWPWVRVALFLALLAAVLNSI